jgi:hypothetical protein
MNDLPDVVVLSAGLRWGIAAIFERALLGRRHPGRLP